MVNRNGYQLNFGDAYYMGKGIDNGTLLDMHTNSLRYPYATLVNADGSVPSGTKYGYGVWYNINEGNMRVYTGKPTGNGAIGVFAGIIEREPARTNSTLVNGDKITNNNFGLIVKQGVLQYKRGKVVGVSDSIEVSLCEFVHPYWYMAVSSSDGEFYFTAKKSVLLDNSDIIVGQVIAVNKKTKTVDVYTTPVLSSGILGTPTITSFSAGTATANSVPVTLVAPNDGSAKFYFKKTADSEYTEIEGNYNLVYDEANSNYKLEYEFVGLEGSTAYTFKVVLGSPNGIVSDTATATTA